MKNLKDLTLEEICEKMRKGDIPAIVFGIKSEKPLFQLNAVLYGAKFKVKVPAFKENLLKLRTSSASFFGAPLAAYVAAALDVLGIEKYTGEDLTAKRMIKCKFDIG